MTASRRGTAARKIANALGGSSLHERLRPNLSKWEDLKYGKRKRHVSRISTLRLQLVVSTVWLACSLLCQSIVGFSVYERTSLVVIGKSNNAIGTIKTLAAADDNTNEEYAARSVEESFEDFEDFGEEDLQSAGVVIDDLNWRVEKMRLEEANKRRFLKSKPRFLPYEECRKWVQAFGRWATEEDW